jgi:hypothetical protein
VIAFLRPHSWDFPLFMHVLGAMVLFGATLTTVGLAFAGPRVPRLARSAFWTLLAVSIPAWIVMRVGAQWIYSKEHNVIFVKDPTWVGIGFGVADTGLLFLLLTTGAAFWWQRSGKIVAGRVVGGLSLIYLALLVVAWLAMSGKWGGLAG